MVVPGGSVGLVSLFAGRFRSEDDLDDYLELDYDDDSATSEFLKESGLGWYDEDFAEGSLREGESVADWLAGHSYGDGLDGQATTDLTARTDATAIYLIYDFDATGAIPGRLDLVGVYPYTSGPA